MEIYVWSCHLAEYTLIHCHLTLWKNYFFLGKESTFFPFENKSICYFLINVYCSSVISTYCACRQAGNAVPPPMGRVIGLEILKTLRGEIFLDLIVVTGQAYWKKSYSKQASTVIYLKWALRLRIISCTVSRLYSVLNYQAKNYFPALFFSIFSTTSNK